MLYHAFHLQTLDETIQYILVHIIIEDKFRATTIKIRQSYIFCRCILL